MHLAPRFTLLGAAMALACTAHAQDRRTVTEPVIPPVCTKLSAQLSGAAHGLEESDEDKLDTARLQAALDHCGKGHALELAAGGSNDAFLSGPFSIPAGVTLLIDKGVTLFAARDAALYALHSGSCGVVSQEGSGCKPFISLEHAPHAGIMGEGVIDARGGAKILHGSASWWDLAAQARGGGRQQVPRMLEVQNSDDFTLYKITLRNSPNFHVVYRGGKGFTVWGIRIDTPKNARNTDGIDPSGSSDITVTHSFIRDGDDNIAIKGSAGGVQHMSVIDNHFFYGHGMSIGSETYDGVSNLLVRNLTLDGTDAGIRIKSNVSRGGLVDHVLYDDICIRNSKAAISIDTAYNNPGPHSDRIPEFRNIVLHNVQISGGGKLNVEGLDAKHHTVIELDNVTVDNPSRYKTTAAHADIVYGPGPVNFRLEGPDVAGHQAPAAKATPQAACTERFVAFPE